MTLVYGIHNYYLSLCSWYVCSKHRRPLWQSLEKWPWTGTSTSMFFCTYAVPLHVRNHFGVLISSERARRHSVRFYICSTGGCTFIEYVMAYRRNFACCGRPLLHSEGTTPLTLTCFIQAAFPLHLTTHFQKRACCPVFTKYGPQILFYFGA